MIAMNKDRNNQMSQIIFIQKLCTFFIKKKKIKKLLKKKWK